MERTEKNKPLEGILVIDFSQFLSGPSAALRLADLGARVIKIERPKTGDICRSLYISNLELDGDSTLFHSINRNKESFAANLKNSDDLERVKKLIEKADVIIQNFRPEAMKRLGLYYDAVKEINPRIIYAEITGYGKEGPWKDRPGQDLLVQSLSGLPWLNGNADQPPLPFGLAVADMIAGEQLVQGILACLVRRGITGQGGQVEVSLMEAVLDLQMEVLTAYMNEQEKLPQRGKINSAHAYLGAPYGVYATKNGYLALAMGSVPELGSLLQCKALETYKDSDTWFEKRDEIKQILIEHLRIKTTSEWLNILEPADIWCTDVFSWERLLDHPGFKVLDMTQQVTRSNGTSLMTTRCPIRIGGNIFTSSKGSPHIGEDNEKILKEMELNK